MTVLQFCQQDIENWAKFSGDYNRIHFDPSVAKKIGLNSVAVHGMLAMMPLKQESHRLWSNSENRDWQWQVLLRTPLALKECYAAKFVPARLTGKSKFSLLEEESKKKSFMGHYCPIDFSLHQEEESGAQYVVVRQLSKETVMSKRDEFTVMFPSIMEYWIFLDALIFSQIMTKDINEILLNEAYPYFPDLKNNPDRLILLHVTHTVNISTAVINKLMTDGEIKAVQYAIKIEEFLSVDESLYSVLTMPIWLDEQLCLVIEIGVMITQHHQL